MDRLYWYKEEDGTFRPRTEMWSPKPPPSEDWLEVTGPWYWWGQLTRPRFSWIAFIVIITFASLVSGALR